MPHVALVTGATGLLGRQVVNAFEAAGWKVVGTGWTRASPPSILRVNLEDEGAIRTVLDDVKPDAVVHCAANRSPDKCDADPDGTRRINVQATKALAEATNDRGVLLIYISSDYIFPGRPGEAPYTVDSPPEPPNFYGQTKLDGERAVLAATATSGLGVSLRVPVLYGDASEPHESSINVLMNIVWTAATTTATSAGSETMAKKIGMDDWAIRYPTNTEDVARVIKDVSEKYLAVGSVDERKALPAVLQFTSEDHYTKYEICQVFSEIMGLPIDGLAPNKEGNDPGASVQRPYDCHLDTKELKLMGIDVSTQNFKDWWKRFLKAFRK